jgi:hypothetical protein
MSKLDLELLVSCIDLPTPPLEPDVAEMFPTADAVNEALRLLIQLAQRQPTISTPETK